MKIQTLISLTGIARKIDQPAAVLREAIAAGAVKPDATSRCGKKLFVFFKPDRLAAIKLALASKPQIVV